MNVLHFAHSYIPQYGGTTTRLINLLSDPQHHHLLIVPMPNLPGTNDIPWEETFDNITVRRVPLRGGPSINWFAARNARLLAAAVRPDDNIDIVQGHNPPPFARAGYLVARQRKLPIIYEAHRLSFDSFGANRETPLPRVVDRAIRYGIRREERPFFENADQIVVQTEMHKRRILECFRLDEQRIHIIPMGVDEKRHRVTPEIEAAAAALRERYGWRDLTTFYYNGYLGSSNGIATLIAAARQLPPETKKRVRIVMQGRGPLEKMVLQAVGADPDLFQMIPSVPYDQMPAHYVAADVVVIPVAPIRLWSCNNPTKLLEAMALERPVLASDVPGITELLTDGETGYTFRAGDVLNLVHSLEKLLSSAKLSPVGRSARIRVLADRRWANARSSLHEVYCSIEKCSTATNKK